jgi:hypothetical protein
MIPEVLQSARTQSSLACFGNPTYTRLSEDEFAIPDAKLDLFVDKSATIAETNRQLEALRGSPATLTN